jgi:phage FluMu gp28-like protein
MGDYLAKEFGQWCPDKHQYGKIELCNFSNQLKVEIFSKMRMAFEKRAVRVPVNRAVREDLHSVNRVTSDTGGITYRAPRGAGGHADRCTALALALRAGRDQGGSDPFFMFQPQYMRMGLPPRRNTTLFQ